MTDLTTLDGALLFTTERLKCRRWEPTDEAGLYEVYSDPETARYIGDGSPISHEECKHWLQVTATNYRNRGYGMFCLTQLDGSLAGFCGLVHPSQQIATEVKYAFHKSLWGKGLATEMLMALVAHARSAYAISTLIATVAPENTPSQRVLRKAGFEFVEERLDADHQPERLFQIGPNELS